MDTAVEVGGRKRVKCGNAKSDGLQLGRSYIVLLFALVSLCSTG